RPEQGDPGETVDWQNFPAYVNRSSRGFFQFEDLADAIDTSSKMIVLDEDDLYAAQSEATRFGVDSQRDLAATLQMLYDSEINVTITRIHTGTDGLYTGLDFAFASCMEYHDVGLWLHVDRASELASALHREALRKYPNSTYARQAA